MNGAEPAPDPAILRPGEARRRLFMLDLASGDSAEVGPPDTDIWEVDWDGDETGRRDRIRRSTRRSGWYAANVVRLDLETRTARTLYEPTWQIEWLALSPDGTHAVVTEGYASDHGLLNGSVMMVNLVDRRDHRSVARPADGRHRRLDRRRLALVLEDRRHRERLRPDLAGRPARGALARRRVHRRRGDDAGVLVHRRRRGRVDDPPGARQPPELARFDHADRSVVAAHVVQRRHRRGRGVPRRAHDPVDCPTTASRSRVC